MKTKAKKFSHKLLALFMAVLMALTCFTGVLTAYGDSVKNYTDSDVEYNTLAWDILSDEQLATALLDYADSMLAEYGPQIDNLLAGALPTSGIYYYNADGRYIGINAAGIIKTTVKVYTHSVNEIIETLTSVQSVISDFSSFIGDAKNIHFESVKGMTRENSSSCDIIRAFLAIFQKNSADYNGNDVIGEFLRGGFDLGTVGNLASIDIYKIVANALNVDQSKLESDFVYNLVQSLIFNNTNWFTDEEIAAFEADSSTFVYDDVLAKVLSEQLLQKISVLVTYPDGTSSKTRKAEIDELQATGLSYEEACTKLGYDPNLKYSSEDKYSNNILLFQYGDEKLSFSTDTTLFKLGYDALKLAWNTVLNDTVKLIHVNYEADRGHGSNFDNQYYYWASENIEGGWDQTNLPEMYSQANVNAWAEAVYKEYKAESAEEFLGWVKHNVEFDRTVADDATGIWSDIDATTLFNKIRYSPLADYAFDMQTGPINLYFMQTGTANIDAFFASYSDYSSLVGMLNDVLVAAVKDIFVNSDNIYTDTVGDTDVPTMATVNPTTIDDSSIKTITTTLVSNALKMIQYTADTTDKNILNGFYLGGGKTLTEENLEEAMIPLLIACVGRINLGGGQLAKLIRSSDWDGCKDAESVIYLCLREYLSYVLPDKDYSPLVSVASDGTITATLESTILPMARDAVSYVMQGYVPVYDSSSKPWYVEDRAVTDENTIFDLLNSVVCYYADDYAIVKNGVTTDDRAMGVASLLGICDSNGESLVNTSNTIWENFDLIINKLLPVVGTLQGKGYGKADTKDLIWNDVVCGMLNIGDTSIHSSGLGGVSNFIYRLLTIVSAEPIQSNATILTVYDVAKDLINGLLGPRYSGQSYTPVPDATSSHPFDDAVHKAVLVGTSGTNVGILQKAICNFVEFSGYGSSGLATYPDSILRGLLFAVQAVNSFIPDAVTTIGDHQLKMASAEFDTDDATTGLTAGKSISGNVVFTNNSIGVNNAYVDAMNNTVNQLSRYYVKVTAVSIDGSGEANITRPSSDLIAPSSSISIPVTATYTPNGTDLSTGYVVTITYSVHEADGTTLYEGLQTRAYIYLAGEKSWADVVYPASRSGQFNTDLETNSSGQTVTKDGYSTKTTSTFATRLNCLYPEYVVLSTSNLEAVNDYQIRFRNTAGSTAINADKSVDGLFYYDSKSVYNDMTGTMTTVGEYNAIPVWDKETGSLLRKEMYDVSYDKGATWDRGTNNAGYTETEVSNLVNALSDSEKSNFTRRDHVAYTLEEALDANIIQAYHKNNSGVYEYIYMKTGSGTNYDTTLSKVSMRGPADGFYINFTKVTISKNSSKYANFCKYDGSTAVQAGSYDVNLCLYNSGSSGFVNFTLVVGDDKNASSLSTKYNELNNLLSNYREDDFTVDGIYDLAKSALQNALAVQSAVMTPTSAIALSDQTYLAPTTKTVTSEYGDRAYVPYTYDFSTETTSPAGMPIGVLGDAYLCGGTKDGVTVEGTEGVSVKGVYYYDEACTMPIYSNTVLTAADVTNGLDPAGIAVIESKNADGTGTGEFYLKNTPVYETEWDLDTYGDTAPWAKDTDVQATNSNGALLYSQVQYVYRDSTSTKVNSDGDWKAKFPATEYKLIENDGDGADNRGKITQANDYLEYVIEQVYAAIDTSIAQPLLDEMSLVRSGMNSVNFDVVSYNKMVDIAKTAEQKYSVVVTYLDSDGEQNTDTVSFSKYNSNYVDNDDITITNVATTSTLSSVQVSEYLRLFNFYMSKVVERGYIGNQVESEIKISTGSTYNQLSATVAEYDEDGNVTTPAVVTKGSGAADPNFGAWSADGTLVNEGSTVYSTASWNNYVTALAAAIDRATFANSSENNHKARNYYVAPTKNEAGEYISDYTAQVTDNYTVDSNLQKAEIALTALETVSVTAGEFEGGTLTIDGTAYTAPETRESGESITIDVTPNNGYVYEYLLINGEKTFVDVPYTMTVKEDVNIVPVLSSVGHSVSGSLVAITTVTGGTANKAPYGEYTISVYNDEARADENLVTTVTSDYDDTAKTNTFTIESLPDGTYYAKVEYDYALTREDVTITVDGADITGAVIPVVNANVNNSNTLININDVALVKGASTNPSAYPYCDLNADGLININDVALVKAMSFGTLQLDPVEIA